ncbi:MAG: hypothetical protein FWG72_07465 [Oscillospiraceae bacterium]|nr:hypothetical protein [Oscillospiraceae bacterium]
MGETANKLIGIFTEAAVDAVFDEVKLSESEKVDKAIKAVKGTLDKAHTGTLAIMEAKPLHNILSSYCREDAISLIDKKVKKYEKFINATTPITGRRAIYAENPYADKSDEHIKTDIKFTILIIYFAAITEESVKMVITKALKGIFGILKNTDNREGK